MQDVSAWEGIAGVDRVSDPHHDIHGYLTGFRIEATVAGAIHPGTARVMRSDPGRAMEVELTTRDLVGLIEVVVSPLDGAARVEVTLTIRSRSFAAGLFFPSVASAIGRGIQSTVDGFAHRL